MNTFFKFQNNTEKCIQKQYKHLYSSVLKLAHVFMCSVQNIYKYKSQFVQI